VKTNTHTQKNNNKKYGSGRKMTEKNNVEKFSGGNARGSMLKEEERGAARNVK